MAIETLLTKLFGVRHPILLAPMDLVSDAKLTAAVSAAGGFGILGGGYGEQEWLTRELDLLERSGQRFGVGFITWSMAKQPKLLDLALERKPAAIMLSFGDPAPFAQKIKNAGALLICQVQSLAMARQAARAGADILIVQGTEAGGHGVARGLFAFLPEVADALGPGVPLVASGGIADGRGLAAAMMLGASGILMGTRFYATQEAAGAKAAKERIVAATGDDTLRSIVFDISRRNVWPAPFTGRCIRNKTSRALVRPGGRTAAARRRGIREIPRSAQRRQLRRRGRDRRRVVGTGARCSERTGSDRKRDGGCSVPVGARGCPGTVRRGGCRLRVDRGANQ